MQIKIMLVIFTDFDVLVDAEPEAGYYWFGRKARGRIFEDDSRVESSMLTQNGPG
jgi:hypothetical protein